MNNLPPTNKRRHNAGHCKHEESRLQRACVTWFRLQYPNHVLFACPNGGFRNAREAAILKAEGVISGVADLFLMCTAKGCSGLFIEMKTSSGRQSKAQIEFESKCIRFGYKYAICRSVEEFIKIINKYIS